jgi:glycosyltransferase involved in cell wall biosynthesis
MNIAYLLGSLNRGGTETLLLDLFKNASKAHFKFVGIHRKNGALKSNFYAEKPKFYKITPKFPFVNYFLKLRKILKKENIQIVHSQQFIDTFFAKIATLGTKIKIVQTYHGFENLYEISTKILTNRLLAFIIKHTDRNFFVSDYQREYYTQKYRLNPQKQATVYNGISFEKLDKIAALNPLDFCKKSNLILGSVGNFNSVRNQMAICRFLHLLNQKNIDFQFIFVGAKVENESFLYEKCYNFCKKNNLLSKVDFLGSRNDVPSILQQLDAFIYSSNHDTFGIAVIEAIAAKIPVFVNDWAVMREITENGKLANLYKTEDENDLLEKFLLLLQNKENLKLKAENNAVEIRKKFSIENHILNLEKQYNLVKQ